MTFTNGKILNCGGWDGRGTYALCYNYNFDTQTWQPSEANMILPRGFASAVMINNTHWWITGEADIQYTIVKNSLHCDLNITGGQAGETILVNTELYDTVDKSFSSFIDLPISSKFHNIVKINETHFFLCCGLSYSKVSYILDMSTMTWTLLGETQYNHDSGFAGKIFNSTSPFVQLIVF